jgi:hypothetical protein
MFTKAHMEVVADIVARLPSDMPNGDAARHWLALRFAEVMRAGNPRFDPVRFHKACNTTHSTTLTDSKRR